MIVGLPGFGLGAVFYTFLLLGMGAKGLWGWVRRAGQLGSRSGRVTVRERPDVLQSRLSTKFIGSHPWHRCEAETVTTPRR